MSVGVDKQATEHRIACKTSSGEEVSLTRTSTIGELLESSSEHFPCTEMSSTRKSLYFTLFFWLAQQLALATAAPSPSTTLIGRPLRNPSRAAKLLLFFVQATLSKQFYNKASINSSQLPEVGWCCILGLANVCCRDMETALEIFVSRAPNTIGQTIGVGSMLFPATYLALKNSCCPSKTLRSRLT